RSGSPEVKGRSNTMPGGCTVSDCTRGRTFRCRKAAVMEVSTGPSPAPERTACHCRYRAFGLVTGDPLAFWYGDDHSLQPPSGVGVLPDLVRTSIRDPDGVVPRQLMTPQRATICASSTSD